MYVIKAHTPDVALAHGLNEIIVAGKLSNSRNGRVLRFPKPVTTEWLSPKRRVSFSPLRDANPFFHLIEALWMLGGRNDVALPAEFAKQIATYSDNGETLNGAYGYRWRKHFGYDQIHAIVAELRKNPESRRCVMSMWDPMGSCHEVETGIGMMREPVSPDLLNQTSKDLPCNLQCLFDLQDGKLNMTVTNRSNDMIWGAYGANVVHFSMLLEYMAGLIGVKVGTYYQVSNNLHVYLDFDVTKRFITGNDGHWVQTHDVKNITQNHAVTLTNGTTVYQNDSQPVDLDSGNGYFEEELTAFLDEGISNRDWQTPFFRFVAVPMLGAIRTHKDGNTANAIELLEHAIRSANFNLGVTPDWLVAGLMWLNRRIK